MSTERRARLAFIGCGGFATASIFPQIPLIPEIDLVAVCDIVEEKAQRNARNFGARRVYTDMHKMLDTEELDGVFTIGPAPQQYELAPVVLTRGLPVYTEKPSANTSAEAKELAELAEANGTWGQVGFMKRFADVYTLLPRKSLLVPNLAACTCSRSSSARASIRKSGASTLPNGRFSSASACTFLTWCGSSAATCAP